MNHKYKMRVILTALSAVVSIIVQAQTAEEIAARYPDEYAVVLNDEQTINLLLKKIIYLLDLLRKYRLPNF